MTNPEISFNSLLYNRLENEQTYYFSNERFFNSHPIATSYLPPQLCERLNVLTNHHVLFYSFKKVEDHDTIPFSIDLKSYPAFAQQALQTQIVDYFYKKGYVNSLSFIHGVMIYVEDKDKLDDNKTVYESFELRVSANIRAITLLVSYCGKKSVSKLSVQQLLKQGVEASDIAKVVYNNRLLKLSDVKLSDVQLWEHCYPKLNRTICRKLGYAEEAKVINTNKYATYLNHIETLLQNELSTDEFMAIFPHSKSWIHTPYSNATKVSYIKSSNQLRLFGNNQKDGAISSALVKYGPYKTPPFGNYTFFYIYHKDHIESKDKMESALSDSLPKLIRLNYSLNPSLDIIYTSNIDPYLEIKKQIMAMDLKPQTTYIAIYLSLTDKVECSNEQSANYYKIKELFLQKGIVSQAIHHTKINSSGFNYFIPNMAVALCAKLGGIPWLDSSELTDELVIGIGAYRSLKNNSHYIGNACAFSSNGLFRGLKGYPASEIQVLAGKLAQAVSDYVNEGKKLKRIIIHFYKVMSDKELQPIQDMLSNIDIKIPIIIITINKTESSDYLIFDTSSQSKMPLHGTAVNFKDNQWLLCNNERYDLDSTVSKSRFPLKLRFNCDDSAQIENKLIINDYLPQIIMFSKLYWKSVSNKSQPVTMLYPEMVAQFYQHFETPLFDDKFETIPWFL